MAAGRKNSKVFCIVSPELFVGFYRLAYLRLGWLNFLSLQIAAVPEESSVTRQP